MQKSGLMLLLTASDVAAALGVSARQVWRLRDRGALPAPVRVGGSTRWRSGDIQSWIDAGCPNVRAVAEQARKRGAK